MSVDPFAPLKKDPFKYRARGRYTPTGRDSFVTTVWRETPQEAFKDITTFSAGKTHTNLRVIAKRKYSLKHGW